MSAEPNPTLRRRELAKYFRNLRHERGYQLEQVAAALQASTTKASRIESGERGVSLEDIHVLSDFYELPRAERVRLLAIAKESRQRGWWQRVDLPAGLRTFYGLEQAAVAINEYNTSVVPGLLQTPEYAAAIVQLGPRDNQQMADTAVSIRMSRQRLLERPDPPELWVVVDEAALARVMGDVMIMSTQLRRLHEMAARPHVTMQVIPFEVGAHPGLNSNFVLLQLSEDRLSDAVYSEGLAGALFTDTPDDVRRYRSVWARLRAIALSPEESLKRLSRAAVGLRR